MLGHLDIDTLRDRVERDIAWTDVPTDGVELGAALEFAIALIDWRRRNEPPRQLASAESWSSRVEVIGEAARAIEGGAAGLPLYDAPERELLPLGSRSALAREGALFFDRFKRSLEERAGVASKKALAISKAAFDMADNAIQHSGADENAPAAGAVGFEIGGSRVIFAVADCGRGVLASLTTNPAWHHLSSARDALAAAVLKRASRWPHGGGNGFGDLLNALADHAGRLRFASDKAVLGLDGTDPAKRTQRISERRPLGGLQLSISIDVDATI